jgi:thiol-disulfide isomerase/thioredoxin
MIQEWARIYKDRLTVILVMDGTLAEEERNGLMAAGVHPVFDSPDLWLDIDPGPLNYSFFIDEEQKIVHRFTFEEHKWREMVRDIDLFARQSIVPKQTDRKPMELGKPLTLVATLAGGKLFDITDFQGRRSIFFLVNPSCGTCKHLYPLIRSLKSRYEGELNVGLIFSVYNYQTDQLIREFYDRYGLGHDNMENRYIENPKRFLEQCQLDDMVVFFDQNNRLFHQDLFWMTPTVMIVDQDLKLIDIFGVGEGGQMELSTFDRKIDEMIHAVL